MEAADLEARLRAAEVTPGYLRPRYAGYSFANVPATAAAALGVDLGQPLPADAVVAAEGIERVVVVVVDGFGWAQWTRDSTGQAFFRRLASRGSVVPLSTVFPSETAACLTTFHTGEPPVSHGLIGWGVYVEALDTVVEPLPFETVDGRSLADRDDTVSDAEVLFDGDPLYPDLRDAGVSPTIFQPAAIAASPYSERALDGAKVVGYQSIASLATAVRSALESGSAPQYLQIYYPGADEAAHHVGTDTAAYREACSALAAALDAELVGTVDPAVAAETLVLVTADHGAVDTDPATNVDLFAVEGVRERLRRTAAGGVVPPAGGPRNVHLHVRPGEVEPLRAVLERRLDALVLEGTAAASADLFGRAEPSALFERRVGDLIVVPRERSVWHGADPAGLEYVGMHGGLHPDELLVPLASARLGDLAD